MVNVLTVRTTKPVLSIITDHIEPLNCSRLPCNQALEMMYAAKLEELGTWEN
jgi:hypothetical protein